MHNAVKTYYEKTVDILGEPDEYQENVQSDRSDFAAYHFRKATMQICINTNGIISHIKYIASENAFKDIYSSETPTEYIKDLQASHSYAENIYGDFFDESDQAYYHPYDE